MFSKAFVPDQESRNNCRTGTKCKECDGRSGSGGDAEEFGEHPFAPRRVLVKKDSNGFVLAERFKDVACGAAPLYRSITAQGAVMRNQVLDVGVVNRPDHKFKRVSVNCMGKRTQFPRA